MGQNPLLFGFNDILFFVTLLSLITFRQNKTFFFYTFSFLLLAVATPIINLVLNNYMSKDFFHDFMALMLNILFVSVIVNNKKISISKLLQSLYIVVTIYSSVVFTFGVLLQYDLFWWRHNIEYGRLSGLSDNPNQTSLLIILLSGLSLYYFDKSQRVLHKIFHLLIFLFSLLIALYVGSDAFYIGVATLVLFSILFTSSSIFRTTFIIILISSFLAYLSFNIESIEHYLTNSSQVQERFYRWLSFGGLFPQVLFVGFGLGGHGPSFIDSFNYNIGIPLQGPEFHNSYLDFFSQFGIVYGLFIMGMYANYLFKIKNRELYFLIALSLAVLAMSFFHMFTRHPIFWFLILLPLIYKYKEYR
jgi:hypothetical protein